MNVWRKLVEDEVGKMVSFGQVIPSTRSRWIVAITGWKLGTLDNKNEMKSWRWMERMT